MSFLRSARFLLFATVTSSVFLTACFGGEADLGAHVSGQGLIPENFMPADVGMVLSYSLNNDEQFAAVQTLEEKLGDAGRLTRTVAESFNAQFADAGLDYEKDLMPAFGEQFRWVYGARPKEEGAEVFSVTTLGDPDQMVSVFDTLSEAGSFEKKVLSGRDVYVNAEATFYATVHEDLLLVSDTPENVVSMLDQDEGDSLWNAENYQEAMGEIGQDFVFYGFLFPELYNDTLNLSTGLSIANIPSAISRQSIVVRAEAEGLSFDVNMLANKEKAKDAGLSFDVVPKEDPYLYKEVPAEGLMAYFESYGLQQTLEQADKLGDDTSSLDAIREGFRNYFGMDFDEDFMSWFDRGYVLALNTNDSGLFPGITLYVDSSSDEEHAQELLNKLDGQISGLMTVFEEALPGAVSKDTVQIQGTDFTKVSIDLTELPRTQDSPLPSLVTGSEMQLIYGVLDGRVLLTTATAWEQENPETIADSVLYSKLKDKLDDADQGLILLDAGELANFAGDLRALREQLDLEVSDTAMDFEDFLDGFSGAIAQSHTEAYSSTFSGYLMLAD